MAYEARTGFPCHEQDFSLEMRMDPNTVRLVNEFHLAHLPVTEDDEDLKVVEVDGPLFLVNFISIDIETNDYGFEREVAVIDWVGIINNIAMD